MRIATARFLVPLLAVIALLAGAVVSPAARAAAPPATPSAPAAHEAGGRGPGSPVSASGGCQPGGSGCAKLAHPSRKPVLLSPAVAHVTAAAPVYGAWAWSGGDMLPSLSVAGGGSATAAEAAAVRKCQAAGGGTNGFGPCVARAWFADAYSAFAYALNGAWGVSWDSTPAAAESDALSYCAQYGTNCQIANGARTPDTSNPGGAVIQPVPSYGVWAISPSAKLARWGAGNTIHGAQRVAARNCVRAGGVPAECSVYGAWAENGYSAISRGANGTWSISVDDSPTGARGLAQRECHTVKAVGLKCTLKGTGVTRDPWPGNSLGWIDQPTGRRSATFTVSSTTGWQQTPIDLIAGDTYSVSHKSGKWTVDYRNFPRVGPQGYTNRVDRRIYQGCKYDPSRNYGVLLGEIGDTGQEFPIGSGGIFRAKASGPLYLRINDDDGCLGDNAGSVTMYVNAFRSMSTNNYAGYSLHPARGVVDYVSAEWKVPSVSCNTLNQSQVAVWVGIWGGPNTQVHPGNAWLMQAGTVSSCEDWGIGKAYKAFHERFPKDPVPVNSFRVYAGDRMYAEVQYLGKYKGHLRFRYDIMDLTAHIRFGNREEIKGVFATPRGVKLSRATYQGGAIVERVAKHPGKGITGKLAKFPAIDISHLSVGQDKPVTNKWAGYRWTMPGHAATGPLSHSARQGGQFTVTWRHA